MLVRTKKCFHSLATDGRVYQGIMDEEEYLVFGVGNDDYRLWDRNGEPILYPKQFFEVTDPRIPEGWVFREYEDAEYHLEPQETGAAGFYEDYFGSDGDAVAQQSARNTVRDILFRMLETVDDKHRVVTETVLERANLRVPH